MTRTRKPSRSAWTAFSGRRPIQAGGPAARGGELPSYAYLPPRRRPAGGGWRLGCLVFLLIAGCLLLGAAAYLLAPFRTNLLLLGIDRAPQGTDLSRTDTNILLTVVPLQPYVGMLSIPRDLWVEIPGLGENRINTAHFFAESAQAGSGPYAAMETVRHNLGVEVDYYVRIRFDGVREVVDALGGLDIRLDSPTAGYPAGTHHLNGEQALAFVRDRQGSDDFFRMARGQLLLKHLLQRIVSPAAWPQLPTLAEAVSRSTDTSLPLWQWPRLGLALLRAGPEGIDSRVISRQMVNPFTTAQGAQVLMPDWEKISPMVQEMFGVRR